MLTFATAFIWFDFDILLVKMTSMELSTPKITSSVYLRGFWENQI